MKILPSTIRYCIECERYASLRSGCMRNMNALENGRRPPESGPFPVDLPHSHDNSTEYSDTLNPD